MCLGCENPVLRRGQCSVGRWMATTSAPPAFPLRVLHCFQSEDFRLPGVLVLRSGMRMSSRVRHRVEEVIGQLSTVLDDDQIEDMVQAFTRKGLL